MGEIHQPCPDCGSSDALQINDDGTTYCHSCKKYTSSEKTAVKIPEKYIKGKIIDIPERGLLKEACKKYSYTVTEINGRKAHIATYKDLNGNIKWQKVRYVDDKEFFINKLSGNSAPPLLFGMNLFVNCTKKLTITEGEIDCLTVSQIFGNRYAVVSLPMGAGSAEKAIRYNFDWINQFDEIILMFDNDEAGKQATQTAASLLPVGKVKIVSLSLKDANEMLLAQKKRDLEIEFYQAREYRPDGIIFGEELYEHINKPVEKGLPYPFSALTNATYGVRKSEYIIIGAGTGIGKTTILTSLEKHFGVDCNQKIGILHLEQQVGETCLYLMSAYAQKPIFRPDCQISPDERRKIFNECINNGNFYFYNAFGTTDFEVIKKRIRYMVIKQNCSIIFLDHISVFASGAKAGSDVNQLMRNISCELASLTKELNITLFAICHLRKSNGSKAWEEGAIPTLDDFEGSSDIVKWGNFVFVLCRNKLAKGDEKHISKLICLKDRYTGKADGLCLPLRYSSETCQMVEDICKDEFVNSLDVNEGNNENSRNSKEQEEF